MLCVNLLCCVSLLCCVCCRSAEMEWCTVRKQYCGLGLGLLMLAVGVALIPIVDYIIKREVEKVYHC